MPRIMLLALLGLLPLLRGAGVYAQTQQVLTPPELGQDMVQRFYRGRAIINSAVAHIGGTQTLRGVAALAVTLDGAVSNDVQGFSARDIGRAAADGQQVVVNLFDFRGGRFAQRLRQTYRSGYDSEFATMYSSGTTYNVSVEPREYTVQENSPSPAGAGGLVAVAARWIPPLLLQRAAQNFRSVVWIADGVLGGQAVDIVEFSFDESMRMRLYVSRLGAAVLRVDAVAPDPISADDVSAAEFAGDQTVAGVHFPERVTAFRRDRVVLAMTMRDVQVNPALADSDFVPPPDYRRIDVKPTVVTTRVADHVYEVSGLANGTYRSAFVVMEDFVVAYEAPIGIAASRQVIAEIRKVEPAKPIRYVVISHFHNDHAGGVGAYVDIGATVVSAADNRVVLAQYAASRPQFQGLEGRHDGLDFKFLSVTPQGARLVDSTGRSLEVIDFQNTTHVEHMLTLLDPSTGSLMQADLYIPAVRWNATFDRFADWLRRHRPTIVTVLGTHHDALSREAVLADADRRGKLWKAEGVMPKRRLK